MQIALSMRVDIKKEYDEPRNAISFDWMNTLFPLDMVPVLIPNYRNAPDLYFNAFDFEGLILTGGDDIRLTPEEGLLTGYEEPLSARDATEYQLIRRAMERRVPTIGVCRGFQLINLFFGGQLVQNLKQRTDVRVGHVGCEHDIVLQDREVIALIGKNRFSVNSYHNQGVDLQGLARPLQPFAMTDDNVLVEGFFHETLPIMGIMWHPEREKPLKEETRLILHQFLKRKV